MGAVHVRAWQAAYRGIMPDEYLDGLRVEDRAQLWRDSIPRTDTRQRILVVEVDGSLVGFAAFGREAEPSGGDRVGELYAINLDPDHWGRGLGRALLVAATEGLRDAGFRSAVLWVVPGNARARALYESEGWTTRGETREQDVLGATVAEVRYEQGIGSRSAAVR
jgi:GNAT superfamily N-acetyltransferase